MIFIEKWNTVNDFPDYEISSFGNVYSNKRDIVMKPYHDGWGYQCVTLSSRSEKSKQKKVHRLVAEAFIPNPYNKPEINHIDGNKDNNNVENLEWVTRSENEIHAFKHGLNVRNSYDAGRPKRRVMITETGQIFNSLTDCARYLGCTRQNVMRCANGKYEQCMGYHIKFI